jgi:nitrogen fixation NifU-like protein
MAQGDAELGDLYRDVLLDYFRSPSHKGRLEPADLRGHGVNPLCGDEIELTMATEGDRLSRVRYAGHGCVISQASSAMMAEALEGRSLGRARELIEAFRGAMLRQSDFEALPEELSELQALEGVRKFPVRIKCALLAWNTMKLGLETPTPSGAEFTEGER